MEKKSGFFIQAAVDTVCINGCGESFYVIGLEVGVGFFFVFVLKH